MNLAIALLAAALALQAEPPREERAMAERFLAAAREGQTAAARRELAPGTPVQPWVGSGTIWHDDAALERFAALLRTCGSPAYAVRPPRSLGNATQRALLVATLACPDRAGRVLTIRFRFGRGRLIDNIVYGLDWQIPEAEAGQPRRQGGPTQPPVTDRERDAFRAALDAGDATAIRAVVGPLVLRLEPGDNFVRSSPEALVAATRGCFVFGAERVFANPDMFFDMVCLGRPGMGLRDGEEPGFGLKLWHHPSGGLAVYFAPNPVQVRPREQVPVPPPAPRPRVNPMPVPPTTAPGPAEIQAARFRDWLAAGNLANAQAALPAGVRFTQPMARIRAATQGCIPGGIVVTAFSWLDPPQHRAPPPGRPSALRATAMIMRPGAPPPNAEEMALGVHWDCQGSKPDIMLYFYLVSDEIVRVGYEAPAPRAP